MPGWQLPIPPVGSQTGAVGANVPNVVSTSKAKNQGLPNLLQYQPTMMERWLFTGIWVPCLIEAQPAVEPAAPTTASLIVQLLYGGDVVWSRQQELAGITKAQSVRSIIVAESFNQPIEVVRGRDMQLEAILTLPVAAANLYFAFSAVAGPTGTIAENSVKYGQLSYNSEKLSGHKEL